MSRRIKLIAVDIDYTLLNSEFRLSERNKKTILRAADSGAVVTLATGRMYRSALPFAESLDLDVPLITYNGAYVRSSRSGRVFSHIPVEREHAIAAIRLAASEDLHCSIYVDDTLYMSKNGWESRMYTSQCEVSGEYRQDLEALLAESGKATTKVLLIGEECRMPGVKTRLADIVSNQAYVTSSTPQYVELMNREVSKGKALRFLCDSMGVSSQDVMAIGDNYNDIDMLRYAGVGVAMADSPDAVKDAACFVAPSNDEDGVAVAIETYMEEVKA